MQAVNRSSQLNEPLSRAIGHKLFQQRVDFIVKLNRWTHFVTLTYSQPNGLYTIGQIEALRRSRLFLSRLNQKIFGRHGCRRSGFRIGSCAVLGWGVYGDHPHTHWLLTKPPEMTDEEFIRLINVIASTTRGIGKERDIQTVFSNRVVEYLVNHGFEGWIAQLTFAAKCPVR
jgi:hypothetical protein